MIYDKLKNIHYYKGMTHNLDTAINFLESTNLKELLIGKTEIDGENVYVNVMDVETKEENEVDFEYHKEYMDIQIDILGSEKIQIGLKMGESIKSYVNSEDFGLCKCQEFSTFFLDDSKFVICMQNEPHKPTLKISKKNDIKKCIIKVKV